MSPKTFKDTLREYEPNLSPGKVSNYKLMKVSHKTSKRTESVSDVKSSRTHSRRPSLMSSTQVRPQIGKKKSICDTISISSLGNVLAAGTGKKTARKFVPSSQLDTVQEKRQRQKSKEQLVSLKNRWLV